MAWAKVLGWGLAEGGAVRAAWASLAVEALERRFTCVYYVSLTYTLEDIRLDKIARSHLVANAPPQILEALADVGRVVVRLVGILARSSQQFLVRDLERLDADFELYVVVRQLGLLGRAARLLFDPLLAAGCEGRHRGRDLVGEGAEFVHD